MAALGIQQATLRLVEAEPVSAVCVEEAVVVLPLLAHSVAQAPLAEARAEPAVVVTTQPQTLVVAVVELVLLAPLVLLLAVTAALVSASLSGRNKPCLSTLSSRTAK
jgi:hypothetical protein